MGSEAKAVSYRSRNVWERYQNPRLLERHPRSVARCVSCLMSPKGRNREVLSNKTNRAKGAEEIAMGCPNCRCNDCKADRLNRSDDEIQQLSAKDFAKFARQLPELSPECCVLCSIRVGSHTEDSLDGPRSLTCVRVEVLERERLYVCRLGDSLRRCREPLGPGGPG